MSRAQPRRPPPPPEPEARAVRLEDDASRRGLRLTGGTLEGGRGISIEDGLLQGVSLAAAAFRLLHLRRVRLVECDLSNSGWDRAHLEEVTLEGCRMTGFHFEAGTAAGLLASRCQARYAQFTESRLEGARFEDCDLSDSSFIRCRLGRAAWVRTKLAGAVLSGSRLEFADLRGCDLEGLRAGLEELDRATVDPDQAAALLRALGGITVRPADPPA